MNRPTLELTYALSMLLPCGGCFFVQPAENLVLYRQPWQMIEPMTERQPMSDDAEAVYSIPSASPPSVSSNSPLAPPSTVSPKATPKVSSNVSPTASSTVSPEASPKASSKVSLRADGAGDVRAPVNVPRRSSIRTETIAIDIPPEDLLEQARRRATQRPQVGDFVDAVQIYDFVPGSVYEVITTPGFLTLLRLRAGEEILHLAAGDTSRWTVDTVVAGIVDPHATLSETLPTPRRQPDTTRVSILIKPRRPRLETNLVIATNQRTYLIDLKSVEATAYHSVVAWTYPRAFSISVSTNSAVRARRRDDGTRNYAYDIKVPPGPAPKWSPISVFDDGHRVHVRFPEGIDDLRRPPLFIVGRDGAVRLVNYHVDGASYVVHELFDRAELRLGYERVVIDRRRSKSKNPIVRMIRAIGRGE